MNLTALLLTALATLTATRPIERREEPNPHEDLTFKEYMDLGFHQMADSIKAMPGELIALPDAIIEDATVDNLKKMPGELAGLIKHVGVQSVLAGLSDA